MLWTACIGCVPNKTTVCGMFLKILNSGISTVAKEIARSQA